MTDLTHPDASQVTMHHGAERASRPVATAPLTKAEDGSSRAGACR
jgi:hypothetical protein